MAQAIARKHPKALPFLFFTEMWERFGFYLMIGIFQLYMTAPLDEGGLGFDRKNAADIYGTFIAFVFLTPFLGGMLADRVLGYGRSIYLGGILMGLGYCGLALEGMTSFYISLSLIILGNGFFKPNISTLLGNLYSEDQFKVNKDSGYNIFYMGINIGALVCNFIAAFMRNRFGWEFAFLTAGIGMFVGLIIFAIGTRHYKHADIIKKAEKEDMSVMRILTVVLLPAVAVGIGGWFIPGNILGSDSTDAFIFAAIPIVIFYVSLWVRASEKDKRPIAALLAIMAVSVMFWAVFKQNGTALTTWAQFYTDREMPAAIAEPAEDLYMAESLVNAPDSVAHYNNEFQLVKKNGVAEKIWDRPVYFRNISPEKMPPEGANVRLVNTEIYQSVNPFWVVALTPVIVLFWGFLRKRKLEPSTPGKIGLGLLISALSTLIMVWAVYATHNGLEKASAWWLISCYGVITVGELFLSPMGLSVVSKLSPPRLTALMMGGWFLSTSIGNKLSGVLATLWDSYDNKANYFLVNFFLLAGATILMFSLLKWLKKIFKENAA
ncbi:MAG: peptide MFS transporter [Bacteroidia bacterium]